MAVRLVSDDRPRRDLAVNRPGEAVREQAVASRQVAPVKTVLARMLGMHTDERARRLGADGEEAVALRLLRLDPEWKFLYAVPVGERGSDIDRRNRSRRVYTPKILWSR
jgi:hypothetical protein